VLRAVTSRLRRDTSSVFHEWLHVTRERARLRKLLAHTVARMLHHRQAAAFGRWRRRILRIHAAGRQRGDSQSKVQYTRLEAECLGFRFHAPLTAILRFTATICVGNHTCVADFALRLEAILRLMALRFKACILYRDGRSVRAESMSIGCFTSATKAPPDCQRFQGCALCLEDCLGG